MAGYKTIAAYDASRPESRPIPTDASGLAASYPFLDESGKIPVFAAVPKPSGNLGAVLRIISAILLATLCTGVFYMKKKVPLLVAERGSADPEIFDAEKTKAIVQDLQSAADSFEVPEEPSLPPFDENALKEQIDQATQRALKTEGLFQKVEVRPFTTNPELTAEKRKIAASWDPPLREGKITDSERRDKLTSSALKMLSGIPDSLDGAKLAEAQAKKDAMVEAAKKQWLEIQPPQSSETDLPSDAVKVDQGKTNEAEREKKRQRKQERRKRRKAERRKKEAEKEKLKLKDSHQTKVHFQENPVMSFEESVNFCKTFDQTMAQGKTVQYPATAFSTRFKRVIDKVKAAGAEAEKGILEAVKSIEKMTNEMPRSFPVSKAARVEHAQAATLRFANLLLRLQELQQSTFQEIKSQTDCEVFATFLKRRYRLLVEAEIDLLRHFKSVSANWSAESAELLQQLGTALHAEEYADIQAISTASGFRAIVTVVSAVNRLRTNMAKAVRSKNELYVLYGIIDAMFSAAIEKHHLVRSENWSDAGQEKLLHFQRFVEKLKADARAVAQKKGFNPWFVEIF